MNDPTRWAVTARMANLWSAVSGRFLQLLGRQPASPAEAKVLLTDLCVAAPAYRQQRYQAVPLPDDLLAAFAVEPLAAGDLRFIGREAELQRFDAALVRWRAGRNTIIAVVGRQGYGTSSFLQQLALRLEEQESFRYGRLAHRPQDATDTLAMLSKLVGCKRPVESLEKLVEFLQQQKPRVIVVDDAHFFAGRIMGAEESLRCFGALMVATQSRHLWVVGFELFAWQRIGYAYGAQRYFDDCIQLPAFSEAELGQCFTVRLRAAGLALEAEAASGNKSGNKGGKNSGSNGGGEAGQMPSLLTPVLSDLSKLSEGKPDLAFFYFLDALFVGEESRELSVRPLIPMDFSPLKQLVHGELFTLAEIAANGQLSIADHRAVFLSSQDSSWLLLEHLHHLCLLQRCDKGIEDTTYRLMPLYSNVINKFLTNANYLY